MISTKKSYAEQLLQFVLALSLLRTDPENYLDWGWETRLAGTGVGGWQLEMRAAPLNDYVYANRKTVIPLIEDLARYNRYENYNDVQAYLLNVQSGDSDLATPQNNTTAEQDTTTHHHHHPHHHLAAGDPTEHAPTPDREVFLSNYETDDVFTNPDTLEENGVSLFDPSLADLNEDQEIPNILHYPFQGLPLKDDVPDLIAGHQPLFDLSRHYSEDGGANYNTDYGDRPSTPENLGGIIHWNEYFEVKDEERNATEPTVPANRTTTRAEARQTMAANLEVKQENTTETTTTSVIISAQLTQEEMDLIEVLWKQDVDLGFSLSPPKPAVAAKEKETKEDAEKLKVLLELKENKTQIVEEEKTELEVDPWAGLSYTIDNETGEYVLQASNGEAELPLPLDDLFLDEGLNLAELEHDLVEISKETLEENDNDADDESNKDSQELIEDILLSGCKATNESSSSNDTKTETDISSLPSLDETDELDLLCDMMMTSTAHFQHPRQPPQNYGHHGVNSFRQAGYHQTRGVPMTRAVSMEQRWQDLANLLSFPPGMGVGMGVGDMSSHYPSHHYPHHYPQATAPLSHQGQFGHPHTHPAVLHNASLADIGAPQPHYGPNLGSAVSTSMHLTNSTSETDAGVTGYKMEHDMMYYSNASSEMNHTSDGFLNSILNDEDLQLMDMAVNEGMYTMRMLDHNSTSNNSSGLGATSSNSGSANALIGPATNPMQSSLIGSLAASSGATGGATHTTGDRLDASSDSAVSSMGSERVPSLSDGEWGDGAGSDSAQEYHHTKYHGGPFDYSYNSRLAGDTRPIVAQKKHQMFGKRYFQDQNPPLPLALPPTQQQQGLANTVADQHLPQIKYEYDPYGMTGSPTMHHQLEGAVGPAHGKHGLAIGNGIDIKYPYSMDFPPRSMRHTPHDMISHNHTYTLPHGSGTTPRISTRDKRMKKAEEEHLTRDEKRARALQIPISVHDVINLPMDEFNERLSKYDLSETQLSLIRDIRRRGKNKVAAQNCRKRKLDQILSLADEVKLMKTRKEELLMERESVTTERRRIKEKFTALYRHVFQNLRDPDGQPYSSYQYSLQQSADGSVVLVQRSMEGGPHDPNAPVNRHSYHHQNSGGHHSQHHPHHPHPHHPHQKE